MVDQQFSPVAIVGAGALGRWLAARLQAAAIPVCLITRPGTPEQKLRCQIDGELSFDEQVKAMPADGYRQGEFSIVLFCTKAGDLQLAARETVGLLADGGIAVVLSNGLGHGKTLLEEGFQSSLAATVTYGLFAATSGCIEERGSAGCISVGPLRATGLETSSLLDVAQKLADQLQLAGLASIVVEDGRRQAWIKAMLNAGLNPVAALLGCTNGEVPTSPCFDLSVAAAMEVVEVAGGLGVDLSDQDPEGALRRLCRDTAPNRCSTLQDLTAGRRTEMEWVCGAVARLGQRVGVETPTNRLLAKMVSDRELIDVVSAEKKLARRELELN